MVCQIVSGLPSRVLEIGSVAVAESAATAVIAAWLIWRYRVSACAGAVGAISASIVPADTASAPMDLPRGVRDIVVLPRDSS
ncbi:hypothetical protein [Cutibacterium acnes]|uniref:hypothetical protein n=1 Tax=Cutibacterium acnes TaxID=1747 RepID=UPI001F1FEC6A|nr:hypothetical protein [Cutibacterium acnes]